MKEKYIRVSDILVLLDFSGKTTTQLRCSEVHVSFLIATVKE